jgi:hypothetical protein
MLQKIFFTAVIMAATVSVGTAGSITNGTWSPSDCGAEPVAPVIEQSSVDAYNKSIKAINEWQQNANTYNTCLINQANADNALIAKTANEEQSRLRATIEKIRIETDAAKAKLDKK